MVMQQVVDDKNSSLFVSRVLSFVSYEIVHQGQHLKKTYLSNVTQVKQRTRYFSIKFPQIGGRMGYTTMELVLLAAACLFTDY